MSQVRLNFLNWRPDADDLDNELIECKNVLHRPEGYAPYLIQTAGAVSTSTALNTCSSAVIRSVGTNDQRVVAYIHNATAAGVGYTFDFSVGLFSSGYTTISDYTTVSSATVSSQYTGNNVTAFEVCELADKIFITARAEAPSSTILSGGTSVVVNLTGYTDI